MLIVAAAVVAGLLVVANAYQCVPCGEILNVVAKAVNDAMTQAPSPTTVQ